MTQFLINQKPMIINGTFGYNKPFINFIPIAIDDTFNINADSDISLFNVLSNDSDANVTDSLYVSSIAGLTVGVQGSVSGGGLATLTKTGIFSFGNNTAYDSLFTNQSTIENIDYTVSDDLGATDIGRISVNIQGVKALPPIIVNPASTNYGWDSAYDADSIADYYVNSNVVSSGSGTTPSTAKKTITEAVTVAENSGFQRIKIIDSGVTYRELIDLRNFTGSITRWKTDKPIISGSEVLTGATRCTSADTSIVGPNWGKIFKASFTGRSAVDVPDSSGMNLSANGKLIPQIQDNAVDSNVFFMQFDPFYHNATSFNLSGSQIISITDSSVFRQYTQSQIENAYLFVYGSPNVTSRSEISSYDSATATVTLQSPATIQDSFGNYLYNLVNILPNFKQNSWGFVNGASKGDVDIYIWPNDSADVTGGNVEYAERAYMFNYWGTDSVIIEGLTMYGTGGNNKIQGGNLISTKTSPTTSKTGLEVRHCHLSNLTNSHGDAYGAVWLQNCNNVLFERNTLENIFGEFPVFAHGVPGAYSTGGVYQNNRTTNVSKSAFRFYGQFDCIAARNYMETTGYGGHTNAMNFYEQCDNILIYGNIFRDAIGYVTWQEASNVMIGFNDMPNNIDSGDNRSLQDQANSTLPPNNATISLIWNNTSVPDKGELGLDGGMNIGKPYITSFGSTVQPRNMRFHFVNNLTHGGGVGEPYEGLSGGEQHWRDQPGFNDSWVEKERQGNVYTALVNWQQAGSPYFWTPMSSELITTADSIYENVSIGDFRAKTGSPLETHTGWGIDSIVAIGQSRFPNFDFSKDILGDSINMNAPGAGAYVDPTKWVSTL